MPASSAVVIDPEGAPLTFAWQQIAGPTVTLTNTNTALCGFTAPVVDSTTEYRFRLTVNDGTASSTASLTTATITDAIPPAPVANLAAAVTVQVLRATDGHVGYALDDAYIHLAIAKNVALTLQFGRA